MDEINLVEYLRIMVRRRRLIGGVAFGAVLVATIILLFTPRTYRGKGVLLFPQTDQSAPSALLSRLGGQLPIADLGLPAMGGPGMYAEILNSRTLSEEVIQDLRLGALDVDYEDLQNQIDVTVTKDGDLEICCYAPVSWARNGTIGWFGARFPDASIKHDAACLAADLTNAYIRRLQDFDRKHALRTGSRHRVFLDSEVAKTRGRLSRAEEALRRFREVHPTVPPPETISQQVGQVIDLRTKQIEAQTELSETENGIREAQGVIGDQDVVQTAARVIQENPVVTQLKAQLAQAEVRKAQLLENLTESHPDVVAASEEIAKTQDKIHQEVARVTAAETLQLNPVRQALVQSLAGLEIKKSGVEARLGALNAAMARVERELSDLAKDQMRYLRLFREVKALELVYTTLVTELSKARVEEAKEPDRFTVLDKAVPEKRHFRPKFKVTLLAALVLGLLAGAFVAFVQEGARPAKQPAHH